MNTEYDIKRAKDSIDYERFCYRLILDDVDGGCTRENCKNWNPKCERTGQ